MVFDSVFFLSVQDSHIFYLAFFSFNLKVFCVCFNAKAVTLVLHNLIFHVGWTLGFHLKISKKLCIGFYLA